MRSRTRIPQRSHRFARQASCMVPSKATPPRTASADLSFSRLASTRTTFSRPGGQVMKKGRRVVMAGVWCGPGQRGRRSHGPASLAHPTRRAHRAAPSRAARRRQRPLISSSATPSATPPRHAQGLFPAHSQHPTGRAARHANTLSEVPWQANAPMGHTSCHARDPPGRQPGTAPHA